MVADFLSKAGADRIMSVDLHSGQIQGFFDGPVDHLTADPVLLDYLAEHAGHDLVVVAPDAGRVKVAGALRNGSARPRACEQDPAQGRRGRHGAGA